MLFSTKRGLSLTPIINRLKRYEFLMRVFFSTDIVWNLAKSTAKFCRRAFVFLAVLLALGMSEFDFIDETVFGITEKRDARSGRNLSLEDRVSIILNKEALNVTSTDGDDKQCWAANNLLKSALGIESVDGAILNNGVPMNPSEYLLRVQNAVNTGTWDALLSADYKKMRELDGNFDGQLALAKEKLGWWDAKVAPGVKNTVMQVRNSYVLTLDDLKYLTDDDITPEHRVAVEKFHNEQIPLPDAFAKGGASYIKKASDRRLVAQFKARVAAENQWLKVATLKPALSPAGRDVLDWAMIHEGEINDKSTEFMKLGLEEQKMLAPVVHELKYQRDTWLAADAGRAFVVQLVSSLVNAGRTVLNAGRRTAVDPKEDREQAESRAMLRLANRERMQDWGFFGNSIICAVATIPSMGTVEIDELLLDLGGKMVFKSSMPTLVEEEAGRTSSQERRVENTNAPFDKNHGTLLSGD